VPKDAGKPVFASVTQVFVAKSYRLKLPAAKVPPPKAQRYGVFRL
jgi:hypothetical protein